MVAAPAAASAATAVAVRRADVRRRGGDGGGAAAAAAVSAGGHSDDPLRRRGRFRKRVPRAWFHAEHADSDRTITITVGFNDKGEKVLAAKYHDADDTLYATSEYFNNFLNEFALALADRALLGHY
mmetsp:Transcript_36119/g.88266  ORF Transcript_36119/g.88266 Transcript_36119/m.88266 type:complete len:126 (+) Transcript_36119:295-672(+)